MSTPGTSASEPGPSVAHPRFRATANARGAQRKSVLTVFPSVSLRPARSGAGGAGLPHSRANGVFAATPHATTGARESAATRGGPAARQGAAGRGAPPPPGRTRGCGARGADPGGGALRFLACSSSSGQLGRVPSSCHADVDSARPRRERVGSSHRGSCAELAGGGPRRTQNRSRPSARGSRCATRPVWGPLSPMADVEGHGPCSPALKSARVQEGVWGGGKALEGQRCGPQNGWEGHFTVCVFCHSFLKLSLCENETETSVVGTILKSNC